MIEVKLNVANSDIDTVRKFCTAQRQELREAMVAGQPTRKTNAATLLLTIINRIDRQLADHLQRLEKENTR